MNTRIDDWDMSRHAVFSPDRKYRYVLKRTFQDRYDERRADEEVTFIMLNPSTADENVADPTVRRCLTYARDWGFTTLKVLNLFAFRATDPEELKTALDPIGPDNEYHFTTELPDPEWETQNLVVCAWGSHPMVKDRAQEVLSLMADLWIQPMCLRQNADGQPAHPLYLPKDLKPIALV